MKPVKYYLSALLALCLLLITGRTSALSVDNLEQIIPENSATAKTISWQDTQNRSDYRVEYRKLDSEEIETVAVNAGKRPPLYNPSDPAPFTYAAYLKDLSPETTYEYRICKGDAATGWGSFTTTAENINHYKVLIFGDSQSTDYGVWGRTARTAWNHNQDAAFFVNMGDLSDNGQAYFQWRAWLANANVLTSHLPFAPVLGNHEAYSLTWQFAEPDTYRALFSVPENGPENQQRMAYSFTYGDVHYVSLNTDEEELGKNRPTMLADEAAWLDQDLAAAQKAGKRLVVFMHRPPWDGADDSKLNVNGEYFMPLFDKYQVPLVFTAHEHWYERTVPLKKNQPSEKGTVYVMTGRSGTEAYKGRKKTVDAAFDDDTDQPMYLTLEVKPEELEVTAIKDDGSVIDRAAIPAGGKK